MIFVLRPGAIAPEIRPYVVGFDVVILALFLMLYAFTPSWPRLCLTMGLVMFWALQLGNIALDHSMIFKGLVIKVLFTVALVKGLKSASRVNVLQRNLAQVFE